MSSSDFGIIKRISENKIKGDDFIDKIPARMTIHDTIFKKVYLEKNISYPTAVLGGTIEAETVEGIVKLRVRPGTQSGTAVRLQGQGIPFPNSNRKGDQYVVLSARAGEIHVR